jgi:hypothetical protein
MSLSINSHTPPQNLQDQAIMRWSREDTLQYAEYIKEKMSNWEACTHKNPNNGLTITTTPSPKATIKIIETVSGKILYPSS